MSDTGSADYERKSNPLVSSRSTGLPNIAISIILIGIEIPNSAISRTP